MIEPKYLGISNYLDYKGSVVEVLSVSALPEIESVIVVKPIHRLDVDYVYASADDLKPIELDSGWVAKLNLYYIVTNGFSIQHNQEYGRWGLYLHINSKTHFTGKFFSYVHDVQNTLSSLWNRKIKII